MKLHVFAKNAETRRGVFKVRPSFIALIAALVASGSTARTEQAATPRPKKSPPITFGVQVEYVVVDAIVTDRDGNAVRDLTREDFEVQEDGRPQALELLTLVDVPPPVVDRPAMQRTVPPDVRTNAKAAEGRLYVIVLDDLHTAAMRSIAVRQSARRFLEQYFGDGDVGAVVHTSGRTDASQDLTSDRRLLLAAVDKFMGRKLRSATLNKIDSYNMNRNMGLTTENRDIDEPQRGYYARSTLQALKDVATALGGIRRQRKALLFISEGIDYDVWDNFTNKDASTILDATREAIEAATRTNTSIYSLDPRGLHLMGDEMMELSPVTDPTLGLDSTGLRNEQRLSEDSLRVLADETVGRAAVSTNDFEGAFERVVKDQSSYYLLGYRPAGDKQDGRFHKLSVKVRRPNVTVRARPGYWAQSKSKAAATRAAAPDGSATKAALHALVAQPVQESGLPLAIHAAPFRGAYANEAAVMVTVEVGAKGFRFEEKDGKFHDQLDLSLSAVDVSGNAKEKGKTANKGTGKDSQLQLDLRPETRRNVDAGGLRAVLALDLRPGRYQIRAAARAANAEMTGSVFYDLEVPDFRDAPLSLSGLAISSAAAAATPTVGSFDLLKDVLPAPATTLREFQAADTLAVVAEVYDTETKVVHTVDVTTSVADEAGVVEFRSEQKKETEVVSDLRPFAFVHKTLVPVKSLSPGRHVLRVEARSRLGKGATAVREVAFSVAPPPPQTP
jgi:VWFA-related protein